MKKYLFLAGLCCWTVVQAWFPRYMAAAEMPEISAKSAAVIEAATGRLIFAKNETERLPMASTTKIMTALLTLEQPGQEEPFCVDSQAIRVEGSSMGLTEGAEVTLHALAAGMLLASGNDAANAAAVKIAGSLPDFAILMNQRAAELGLSDTNFETPSGLDGQNHYTTARDLALLGREALQNEAFRGICGQKRMKLCFGNPPEPRWLSNHNRLLEEYEGCIGMKTGFTKKSGRCLVSAAERNGVRVICVTLHSPDDWNDHKKLLDAAFSVLRPLTESPPPVTVPVTGGTSGQTEAAVSGFSGLSVRTEECSHIQIKIEADPFLYAPVKAGQQVGRVCWMLDGEKIYACPLTARQSVPALPQKTGWREAVRNWLNSLWSLIHSDKVPAKRAPERRI